jgi:hypothetical protein
MNDQNPTAALSSSSAFASNRFKLQFTPGTYQALKWRVNLFFTLA